MHAEHARSMKLLLHLLGEFNSLSNASRQQLAAGNATVAGSTANDKTSCTKGLAAVPCLFATHMYPVHRVQSCIRTESVCYRIPKGPGVCIAAHLVLCRSILFMPPEQAAFATLPIVSYKSW